MNLKHQVECTVLDVDEAKTNKRRNRYKNMFVGVRKKKERNEVEYPGIRDINIQLHSSQHSTSFRQSPNCHFREEQEEGGRGKGRGSMMEPGETENPDPRSWKNFAHSFICGDFDK